MLGNAKQSHHEFDNVAMSKELAELSAKGISEDLLIDGTFNIRSLYLRSSSKLAVILKLTQYLAYRQIIDIYRFGAEYAIESRSVVSLLEQISYP